MRFATVLSIVLITALAACSRQAPFTPYLAEQLLGENLRSLTEPPLFELRKIDISDVNADEHRGSVKVDIVLLFPQSLDAYAQQQGITPDDMAYMQYRGSFGAFDAGEIQRHHARYHFQLRGKKWVLTGSEALAPPDIHKP